MRFTGKIYAGFTTYTPVFGEKYPVPDNLALRIMTPLAGKRTAVKKNRRPYPRSVMSTETLNFIYVYFHFRESLSIIIFCHSLLRTTNLAFQPVTLTERDGKRSGYL